MEVLTLGGGSRDWQILDNYTRPKLHKSCQTFSQYLHFGFKYTVFFSLVLRLLSHLTFLNFYHSLNPLSTKTSNLSLNYMNFSTVSDRWSMCAGPEIHFSFSFFHSFLTLIHTSLSRRFWLFLSSSCILPHARFMTVWRLIQTLTGHLTFWEEEVGRRQAHSCCTLHILHWRVRGTCNNSFYFHKGQY